MTFMIIKGHIKNKATTQMFELGSRFFLFVTGVLQFRIMVKVIWGLAVHGFSNFQLTCNQCTHPLTLMVISELLIYLQEHSSKHRQK